MQEETKQQKMETKLKGLLLELVSIQADIVTTEDEMLKKQLSPSSTEEIDFATAYKQIETLERIEVIKEKRTKALARTKEIEKEVISLVKIENQWIKITRINTIGNVSVKITRDASGNQILETTRES